LVPLALALRWRRGVRLNANFVVFVVFFPKKYEVFVEEFMFQFACL
jgi:hypothetical protein